MPACSSSASPHRVGTEVPCSANGPCGACAACAETGRNLGIRIQAHIASGEGQEAWRGPAPAATELESLEPCVASWRDNSITLDAACRAHGIAYLHVLQPTMHDRGSKPVHDEERSRDRVGDVWRRAVEAGYPLLRRESPAMTSRGLNLLDLSMIFAERTEPLYEDGFHFSPRGHELVAQRMAPVVAEILRERAAAAARAR